MKHNDEMSKIALVGPGGRKKLKDILKSVENKVVPQVQADYSQEDETKPDYIKNKPAELTADDIFDFLAQKEYFTIEAKENSTSITWVAGLDDDDDPNPKTIQVSTDGVTWTSKTSDEDGTALATLNAGDKLYIKGNNDSYAAYEREYDSFDGIYGNYFESDKDVYVYGNIMTLVNGEDALNGIQAQLGEYAFARLFWKLRDHLYFRPDKKLSLPATKLGYKCYAYMFYGCTHITVAPKLPAKALTNSCYTRMFSGCTGLIKAPALPAMTLAHSCYSGMFSGCTNLTEAPELPAMTLASYCYSEMFSGTHITKMPKLPATTLADYCYKGMFAGCNYLTSREVPNVELVTGCFSEMFRNNTSMTTAPELPATELAPYCYQGIFKGCTALVTPPELPVTTLASGCYKEMFYGCTSLETAPELPATVAVDHCYESMFYGCTALTEAPELPITNAPSGCCRYMFSGCTALTKVPSTLRANVVESEAYESMFSGCSSITISPDMLVKTFNPSWSGCVNHMFQNCSSLTRIKCLAENIIVEQEGLAVPGVYWAQGVAVTGTFIKHPKADFWLENDNSGIPSGWTVETATS